MFWGISAFLVLESYQWFSVENPWKQHFLMRLPSPDHWLLLFFHQGSCLRWFHRPLKLLSSPGFFFNNVPNCWFSHNNFALQIFVVFCSTYEWPSSLVMRSPWTLCCQPATKHQFQTVHLLKWGNGTHLFSQLINLVNGIFLWSLLKLKFYTLITSLLGYFKCIMVVFENKISYVIVQAWL